MARKRRKRPDPLRSGAARYRAYRRWRRWFDQIKHQIFDIHHRRQVYREVMAMVEANPALRVPSAFYSWMQGAYVNDMTMAVRRLVDRDRRTISFARLMREIEDHPEVMTRVRFVARYPPFLRKNGQRDFERFASPTAKTIHRRFVQRHQRELLTAAERLKAFVDKHVAHKDRRPMRRLPTYAELDESIDVLGRLAKAYSLLLEQTALVEVVPVIQEDWKAPFRIPWIEPKTTKRPPADAIRMVPAPVTPRTKDRPQMVEQVLGNEDWLRDPTAKARVEAQKVIEEFEEGRGQVGDSAPS
jgi:hypothetical protein